MQFKKGYEFMEKFINMSYIEFVKYCEDRSCDGNWGFIEALTCINIVSAINNIRVKKLGFTLKKKTEELREEKWQITLRFYSEKAVDLIGASKRQNNN